VLFLNFHHVVKWQEGSLVPSHYLDTAKGTMKLLTPFLTLVFACLGECSQHKILCGRTGNGKSYISVLLGCQSDTCDSIESCTKEIKHCSNGVIDTIGLDDDGKEYSVSYNGKNIKLSGLTYPIYALFEHLEKEKIHDVEFYLVFDANNLRGGNSLILFEDFVKNDLKCPVNLVLNKYRSDEASHRKHQSKYDIIVPNHASHLSLQGKKCSVGLSSMWRDKLIMSDLKGVVSSVNIETCKKLKTRLDEFNLLQTKIPKQISNKACGYDKIVGYVPNGNSWSIEIGPIRLGSGGGSTPITERMVDEDCARRERELNDAIRAENAALHEEKMSLLTAIESIESKIAECKTLIANWSEL
jgi:hypothetical protein